MKWSASCTSTLHGSQRGVYTCCHSELTISHPDVDIVNETRPARTYWFPVSFVPLSTFVTASYVTSISSTPLAGYSPYQRPCSAASVCAERPRGSSGVSWRICSRCGCEMCLKHRSCWNSCSAS